jgi:hypothetical protein
MKAAMEQIRCGDQVVSYDPDRTRNVYLTIPNGGAERCGCDSCLNFAAQRQSAYPEVFVKLLHQLGIDPLKEGEAYEMGPDNGHVIYGGWFYFAGELVQEGERLSADPDTGFQYWFASPGHFPKPRFDFGPSVSAIEFITNLPKFKE